MINLMIYKIENIMNYDFMTNNETFITTITHE